MTVQEPKNPQTESIAGGELSRQEIVALVDDVERGLGITLLPPTTVRDDVELPEGYDIADEESNRVVYSTYDRLTGVNKMINTTPEFLGVPLDALDLAEAGLFHKMYLELKNLSVHNPLKTGPIVVAGTEARKVKPGAEELERKIARKVTGLDLVAGDGWLDNEYQAAILAARAQEGFTPLQDGAKPNEHDEETLKLIGHINNRPVYVHKVPYEKTEDGKYHTLTTTAQQVLDMMARLGSSHGTLATSNTYIPSRRETVKGMNNVTVTGYGTAELHKLKGEDITNEIAQMLAEFYKARKLASS